MARMLILKTLKFSDKILPSQHTHTGPVRDLSGFAGWDGHGILQRERHGTRLSTPVSLQRRAFLSAGCHRPIDWLIGLLLIMDCFLYMPMPLRLAKASIAFSIASELELLYKNRIDLR